MPSKFIKTLLLTSAALSSAVVFSQNSAADKSDVLSFYSLEAKYIQLKKGDTLLDIGAGSGAVNAMYSALRINLHQVLTDIDPKVLNQKNVKASYKAVFKEYESSNPYSFELVLHGADSLPLASSSFGKILCRRSFHEFRQPKAMLREMRRVLRDTGTVVVIEGLPTKPGEKDPTCKIEYLTADKIVQAFGENGFTLIAQKEETMAFDNDRKLSVLFFGKSQAETAKQNRRGLAKCFFTTVANKQCVAAELTKKSI